MLIDNIKILFSILQTEYASGKLLNMKFIPMTRISEEKQHAIFNKCNLIYFIYLSTLLLQIYEYYIMNANKNIIIYYKATF